MTRLVLIDGNSLLHRAYHALPKSLTTSEGQVVNAVYGFARMLLKVIKDLEPSHLAVAFDVKGPTFRHLEYEKYKEGRPAMDEDLVGQLPKVKELLRAFEIPVYEAQGFEGEDTIAALNFQFSIFNFQTPPETVIVTGDRDVLQLVDEKTKVYSPLKGLSNPVIYDAKEVFERYGLRPDQIVDYKALRGDPSDNIPGVPGVGEKTAVDLLKKYETLEEVFDHLNELTPRQRKLLDGQKEQAELSKRLATITADVPVRLDLEKCLVGDFCSEKAIAALKKLQFKSLVRELGEGGGIKGLKGEKDDNGGQLELI